MVGAVSATDPDAGDSVTLSVDDARFEIVGGQLKLKDGVSLDYEDGASVSVTVTATDVHGATDTQVVTVTVGDLAEAITLADGGVSFTDTGVAETSITGGDGADTITGHDDGANIDGGLGNDTIITGGGDDTIDAGVGDDSIVGGSGSDTIIGHNGDDTIDGGAGADHLAGNYGDDHIDGGDGSDAAHYDGAFSDYAIAYDGDTQTLTISDQNAADGDQGTDTVTNVETFVFDGVNYTLADLIAEAALQANVAPTEVTLTGGSVLETVADGGTIGSANDPSGSTVGTLSTTDANAGDSHTYSLITDASGLFEIVGNEVRVRAGQTIDYESDTSFDITVRSTDAHGETRDEVLTINVQDYAGAFTGGSGGAAVTGTSEEDLVNGGTGADTISGGLGDDTLYAGDGDDSVDGGDGADQLSGNGGNDSLVGGAGADTLTGDSGDDTLVGGSGSDSLLGGADADLLSGGDADDTLRGADGDDILSGDAGDDVLEGGLGADTAVFTGAWSGLHDHGNGRRLHGCGQPPWVSPDGTDTLTDIETFRFSDGDVAVADVLNDGPDVDGCRRLDRREQRGRRGWRRQCHRPRRGRCGDAVALTMRGSKSWAVSSS